MLSLPLAKLSTAPDAGPDDTKFDWRHDTQDLVAVIDTYGSYGQPSQLLKVVQGTHVRVRTALALSSLLLLCRLLFAKVDLMFLDTY
jgi:hypothetical protein